MMAGDWLVLLLAVTVGALRFWADIRGSRPPMAARIAALHRDLGIDPVFDPPESDRHRRTRS